VHLERRLLASARERLGATERMFRLALRTRVDILGAEVAVSTQEQAVEKARGEARRSLLSLREAIGVMGADSLSLTSAAPAVFDPSGLNVDSLVAGALVTSPRITGTDAAFAAAAGRTAAVRGERLPSLNARVSLNRSQFDQDYHALRDVLSPSDRRTAVAVGVSVPLFDQFRTSTTVAQMRADETRAREDARAARLALETEVRGAYIDLEHAHRTTVHAERTVQLSRERVELAQEQYRVGSVSFTELHDAVERSAVAERDALAARYDFAAALVTLEERTGGAVHARP
jgi:outer membrane protein TolC